MRKGFKSKIVLIVCDINYIIFSITQADLISSITELNCLLDGNQIVDHNDYVSDMITTIISQVFANNKINLRELSRNPQPDYLTQ